MQLWEVLSGKCVATLVGHKEEVLDVCFDLSGQLVATASADGEKTTQVLDPGLPVSGKFLLCHTEKLTNGSLRQVRDESSALRRTSVWQRWRVMTGRSPR